MQSKQFINIIDYKQRNSHTLFTAQTISFSLSNTPLKQSCLPNYLFSFLVICRSIFNIKLLKCGKSCQATKLNSGLIFLKKRFGKEDFQLLHF